MSMTLQETVEKSIRPKLIKTRKKEVYQLWVNHNLVAHLHVANLKEKEAHITIHGFGMKLAGFSGVTISTRECIRLNHKATGEVDYTTIPKEEDTDNGTS